jgi:plasmid stabilization system protein ParE
LIAVRYTENFTANLQEIAGFWDEREYPAGFDALLAELLNPVIPNLMHHPRMGRHFSNRQPQSVDGLARVQKMEALLKTLGTRSDAPEVREYVMTDYLLLYLLSGTTIHLLAIKHHKQLAFDFAH